MRGLLHSLRGPKSIPRSSSYYISRCYAKDQGSTTSDVATKPKVPPTEEAIKVDSCQLDPCQPEPTIVIVGAGIAGLSAAARLVQCGLKNFTILEATDRPGGRIHSCWLGDKVAELGAQWIEGGCIANPVFTLAAQEGLLKAPLKKGCANKGENIFVTSDGRAIDWSLALAAYHRFQQIERQAASLFNLGAGRSHGSLHNFMSVRIQQELHTFPEEQRYDAARVMFGLYNTIRYRCGDDLNMVSADQFGSFAEIPGGLVQVPLGFVGVLAPLLRVLPEDSLRCCKVVKQIKWGTATGQAGNPFYCSPPRALVRCNDGDTYKCDYVILTMSLGVLKCKAHHIFCPSLSAAKTRAIESLGYGHCNKIFMEYERPFWVGQQGKGITLAWSKEELNDRTTWVKGLSVIEEMTGSQHVICLYVSGPEAYEMESYTDNGVIEECTQVLRRFTGDPSLPYPKTMIRSNWTSDHNFSGSNSYMAVMSTVGHQYDLGAPLPEESEGIAPILLFAGEATCPGFYGTVHGARLSGIREAERIIDLTRKHLGPPRPTADSPC